MGLLVPLSGSKAWWRANAAIASDGTTVYPTYILDNVRQRYAKGAYNGPVNPSTFSSNLETFTRASTATYFDASGNIQTASVNQPRFTYDPVTFAPLGLLIEEQRTNILLNSAALSTQSVTVTATAYTLSFYGTGSVTLSGTSTGTLAGTGANNRVNLTFTPTAGTLTLTVTGTVKWANLEVGSFATSWISTTSVAVTRAQEDDYTTNMSWLNYASCTFVVEGYVGDGVAVAIGTGTQRFHVAIGPTTGSAFWQGSITQASINVAGLTRGQYFKAAVSLTNNGSSSTITLYVNGSIAGSSNTFVGTFNPSQFSVGRRYTVGTNYNNMPISKVTVFPKDLSASEMARLTA